jgi:hypothetical protein
LLEIDQIKQTAKAVRSFHLEAPLIMPVNANIAETTADSMLETLLLALLESIIAALHLLTVSLAAIGPLACLWLEWREHARGDVVAGLAGRKLARLTLGMLGIGMVLGFCALGLLWLNGAEGYLRALAAIPIRRLWFGAAELAFYFLCMWAYVIWWGRMPRLAHQGLAVLAATNVLYHFPPLFSAVVVISTREHLLIAGQPLKWAELLSLFGDAETLSRVTHMVLAACVVTGVALMAIGLRLGHGKGSAASHPAGWGGRLALVAALLQLPVGVWVLLNLPAAVRDQLLTSDWPATLLFACGVLTMLALLHHLAAAALGDTQRATVVRCMVLTAALFLLMVGAGHRARAAAQETPAGDTRSFNPEPTATAHRETPSPLAPG